MGVSTLIGGPDFDRYLIPKAKSILNIKDAEKVNEVNTSNGIEHSEGWEFFYNLSQELDAPLIIYLHAEKDEMIAGNYEENGHWIMSFAEERSIPVVTDIEIIHEDDYRDGIHLSSTGQQVIYDVLDPVIGGFLSER